MFKDFRGLRSAFTDANPESDSREDVIDNLDEEVDDDNYNYIDEGSFAAIVSATNFELFYIVKMNKRCKALENGEDGSGHCVRKGDVYFEANYLERVTEAKKCVAYKQINKTVYIHPREVFFPAVSVDEELKITGTEYQFVADAAPY